MIKFWGCVLILMLVSMNSGDRMSNSPERLSLPVPALIGKTSLEEVIARRRSVREFSAASLTMAEIGQLCWAGQGVTDRVQGFRASPSAGALFPIELYVVTAEGVDRYLPKRHELDRILIGDLRSALQAASLDQEMLGTAPLCVVIATVVERSAQKYGKRAEQYCLLEAGHVAQNILLQATALKLGGVPVGAFEENQVAAVLKLPKDHRVLYLLPIGHPAKRMGLAED